MVFDLGMIPGVPNDCYQVLVREAIAPSTPAATAAREVPAATGPDSDGFGEHSFLNCHVCMCLHQSCLQRCPLGIRV